MLKKPITYVDYNGVERTEEFYFNLSKAEIAEMELRSSGGLQSMIQGIIDAKDADALINIFKDVIKKSYGKKTPDGRRIMKSEEIWEDFYQTEAYSNLFMELITDDKAAADFMNGIIPSAN